MHPGATVRRLSAVLGLAAMLAGCSGAAATPASTATATPSPTPPPVTVTHPGAMPVAGTPPTDDQPWFLTVGDSVTSGYTVDPARAAVNSSWALQLEPLLAATGRTGRCTTPPAPVSAPPPTSPSARDAPRCRS